MDRGSIGPMISLALAGASLIASLAVAQAAAPFSNEERNALLTGELVRRPDARQEGTSRYIGGTSYQRVRAPRDQVWREILEVSNYPRLIPGVVEARMIEERGSRRVIFLQHRYSFVTASYFAIATVDARASTVSFELDRSRPHDVRDGRGFITVDRFRGRESMVTWGVMADVGSGILTGVFAPVLYDWILKVPWCIRAHVEHTTPGC